MSPEGIAELCELQGRILGSAARLVKPGGRLVYVTCSLLSAENERQAEGFLAAATEYAAVPISAVWRDALGTPCPSPDPYLRLTPFRDRTDGFFVALFERRASG